MKSRFLLPGYYLTATRVTCRRDFWRRRCIEDDFSRVFPSTISDRKFSGPTQETRRAALRYFRSFDEPGYRIDEAPRKQRWLHR